eukprot:6213069-Pleurochrysis_carterae.AAC.2
MSSSVAVTAVAMLLGWTESDGGSLGSEGLARGRWADEDPISANLKLIIIYDALAESRSADNVSQLEMTGKDNGSNSQFEKVLIPMRCLICIGHACCGTNAASAAARQMLFTIAKLRGCRGSIQYICIQYRGSHHLVNIIIAQHQTFLLNYCTDPRGAGARAAGAAGHGMATPAARTVSRGSAGQGATSDGRGRSVSSESVRGGITATPTTPVPKRYALVCQLVPVFAK